MNIRKYLEHDVPLSIGLAIGVPLVFNVWWGFWIVGPWIGGSITVGALISRIRGKTCRQRKLYFI